MTASIAQETNNNLIINPISNKTFDISNINLADFKTADVTGTKFSKIMTDAMNAKTQQAHTNFVDKAAKSNTSSINKKALNSSNSEKTTPKTQNQTIKNTDESKKINNKENEDLKKIEKQNYKEPKENKTNNEELNESTNELNNDFEKSTNDANISQNSNTKNDNNKKPQLNTEKENNEILNETENSSFVAPSPVFSSDSEEIKKEPDTLEDKFIDLSNNAAVETPQRQNNAIKEDLLTDMIEEINSLIENITNSQNSSNLSQENKKDFLEALENLKNSLENVSNDNCTQSEFDSLLNKIEQNLSDINALNLTTTKPVEENIKTNLENLKDILSSTDSEIKESSTITEIKNLINETLKELDNFDSSSIDKIVQNLDKIADESENLNSNDENLTIQIKELKSLIENVKTDKNDSINQTIKNLNNTVKSINEITAENLSDSYQQIKNEFKQIAEFIQNIDSNELKDFIQNNNTDKKTLDEVLNLINSYNENEDDISLIKEISSKLNQILQDGNNKNEEQNNKIVQSLTSLNESIEKLFENKGNKEILNDFEGEDLKSEKTTSNSAQLNNFKDSKDNSQDLNSKQEEYDIVEKMDIETDGFSTLEESGALSVQDEVAKIALSEQGTIISNSASTNVVYDSASGNGVVINNINNLKNMQTPSFQNPNTLQEQLDSSDILNQISNKLTDLSNQNGKKLTMVLRPNDLGRLSIELTTNKDGLTTNIIAQNEDVRNYIEKNINSLKQQLSDAGINVNNIQIKTAGQENSTKYEGSFNQNQQNDNQNNSQNNKQNDNQNQQNKQQDWEIITSNMNYDFQFAKDFSNVLSKTLSYNLNK